MKRIGRLGPEVLSLRLRRIIAPPEQSGIVFINGHTRKVGEMRKVRGIHVTTFPCPFRSSDSRDRPPPSSLALSGCYPALVPQAVSQRPFNEKLQIGQARSGKLLLRAFTSFFQLHLQYMAVRHRMAHAGLPYFQPQTRTICSAVLHGTREDAF
jgi:hypothetical protein